MYVKLFALFYIVQTNSALLHMNFLETFQFTLIRHLPDDDNGTLSRL